MSQTLMSLMSPAIFAMNLVKKAFSNLPFHFLKHTSPMVDIVPKFLHAVLSPDCSVDEYLRTFYSFINFSAVHYRTTAPEVMSSVWVEEVYRLKVGWQPESLCVKVNHGEETRYIVFERTPSDQPNQDPWNDLRRKAQVDKSAQVLLNRYEDLLQASIREGSTLQSSASASPLNGDSFVDSDSILLSAVDSVANIAADPIKSATQCQTGDYDRVRTIDKHTVDQHKIGNGFKTTIPLFDVVILASVVHEQDTTYSLLQNQCYWYCNLIYSVLEKRSKSQSTPSLDQTHDNQSDAIIDTKYETWWRIQVIDIKESLVAFVDEKFDITVSKIRDAVCPSPYYLLQDIDNSSVYPIRRVCESLWQNILQRANQEQLCIGNRFLKEACYVIILALQVYCIVTLTIGRCW